MLRKRAVLLIGAFAVSAATIASASAIAQPVPAPGLELSSRAAVVKYLASHGFDARKIVIQRGARNYAGPHCPGVRWNCTTSKRVVQISFGVNVSSFTCTPSPTGSATSPSSCLIVQSSTNASNNATCIEKTGTAAADQSCSILQTSTTGSNLANVTQLIDTSSGAIQDGTQYTGIEQDSTTGSNNAQVSQVLNQSTTTTAAGGLQKQDGHQTVSIEQNSGWGVNNAQVVQSLALTAKASNLPSVSQIQNTDSTSGLNTEASIRQSSDTGVNLADLKQSHDLDATVSRVPIATQTQGFPSGGMLGHFEQSSNGLSTVHGVQNELQELHADHVPNLTQVQFGPLYWGSDQGSNPGDRYDITSTSTQNASSPGAFQDDQEYANCDTTGLCTTKQTTTQDGVSHSNTCSGPSCHVGQTSTFDGPGSNASTCTGLGEGGCPDPPYPPPPPFDSD